MALPALIDFSDLDIMARTIWGEARGEGRDGKLAVGWAIVNRQLSGRWFAGDSLTKTCMKHRQFSCWNRDDPNRQKLAMLTLKDPTFRECVWAAAAALAGTEPDPTGGATHYHHEAIRPAWADDSKVTAKIGKHVYYKDIA